MMKLKLVRNTSTSECTIGKLYVDEAFQCYTLEDIVRPKKVYGETAIPTGTYKVDVTMSNRFKKLLPILLNVPEFEGVRIHPGNKAADTEGCILVGTGATSNTVTSSRIAFDALFNKVQDAKGKFHEITLEIV